MTANPQPGVLIGDPEEVQKRIKKRPRIPYEKRFKISHEEIQAYIAEFLERKEITRLPDAGIRMNDYLDSNDHYDFKSNGRLR